MRAVYISESRYRIVADICDRHIIYLMRLLRSVLYYRVSQKMYLTLMLYFEAVTTIMTGILGFTASPDLYNSFNTLLKDAPVVTQGAGYGIFEKKYFRPPKLRSLYVGLLKNFRKIFPPYKNSIPSSPKNQLVCPLAVFMT